MLKKSIEKLSETIGFDIGVDSDNEIQANLINGLSKGLTRSMDNNKLETQLCYVVDYLTPESERVISMLMDFIKLKGEN